MLQKSVYVLKNKLSPDVLESPNTDINIGLKTLALNIRLALDMIYNNPNQGHLYMLGNAGYYTHLSKVLGREK